MGKNNRTITWQNSSGETIFSYNTKSFHRNIVKKTGNVKYYYLCSNFSRLFF